MKLIEKMFILGLIEKKYRRRIFFELTPVALGFLGGSLFITSVITRQSDWLSGLILASSLIFGMVIFYLNIKKNPPSMKFVSARGIRERQIEKVNEPDVDFESLKKEDDLKEYFK